MRQRASAINLRVTPAEKRKMEHAARNCQLSLSAYLRKLGLGKTVQAVSTPALYMLYREIVQLQENWKSQPESITDHDFETLLADFLSLYNQLNSDREEETSI